MVALHIQRAQRNKCDIHTCVHSAMAEAARSSTLGQAQLAAPAPKAWCGLEACVWAEVEARCAAVEAARSSVGRSRACTKRPRLSATWADASHAERAVAAGEGPSGCGSTEADVPDTHTVKRKVSSPTAVPTGGIVLVSGGCAGADEAWFTAALMVGLSVEIASFAGHKVRPGGTPRLRPRVHRLTPSELWRANGPMQTAAKRLGRRGLDARCAARLTYRDKLLCRNFHIVRGCTHLYAVGVLEGCKRQSGTLSVGVGGGTGWACQLFADQCLQQLVPPATGAAKSWVDLPMWLFDQPTLKWVRCRAHFVARGAGRQRNGDTSSKQKATLREGEVETCPSLASSCPPTPTRPTTGLMAYVRVVSTSRCARWLEWVHVPAVRFPSAGRVAGVGTRRLSRPSRTAIADVVMPAGTALIHRGTSRGRFGSHHRHS